MPLIPQDGACTLGLQSFLFQCLVFPTRMPSVNRGNHFCASSVREVHFLLTRQLWRTAAFLEHWPQFFTPNTLVYPLKVKTN